MKTCCFLLVLFMIFAGGSAFVFGVKNINTTRYDKMPRLYEFDSFSGCPPPSDLLENKAPDYCVLSVKIRKPESSSKIYRLISNFSSDPKQQFKHDELKRGICLQSCFELHEKLGDAFEAYQTDHSHVTGTDIDQAESARRLYNKLSNVCINKKLSDEHGLIATSSIDHCIDKKLSIPFDKVDYLFIGCVVIVLSLLTISNVYQLRTNPKNHKKFAEKWKRTARCLDAFSFQQNWQRLLEGKSESFKGARTLCAVKIGVLFVFVLSQVYRHIASMPMANPVAVEQSLHKFWTFFGFEKEAAVFFTLCGLEMGLTLSAAIKASNSNWKLFKEVVGTKYAQISTLFTAFVLFSASFLPRIGSRLWEAQTFKELRDCRKNHRLNLLSIHNYGKHDEMCLQPSWIISVDLHLTIAGFVILYVLVKFPNYKKQIIATMIALSVSIVALLIYKFELEPLPIMTPEMMRSGVTAKFAASVYPSHLNGGNFLIGLIFGYLVYSKADLAIFQGKVKTFFFFLSYVESLSAATAYVLQTEMKSTLLASICGAYMRHHVGFVISILTLKLLHNRRVAKLLKGFRLGVAEKLFNSAFMSCLLLKATLSIIIFASSYILAGLLYLTVEAPFARMREGDAVIEIETVAASTEATAEATIEKKTE